MIPERPPKRIYLQPPDTDTDDDDLAAGFCLDGATWCEDRINDCDVEYIRADLAATPAAAPVEVQKISYPNVGENGYGVDVDYYRRELARLAESLPNRPGDELARYLRNLADTAAPQAPAPGSRGAEASREEAIGCLFGRDIDAIEAALDIADRKTDAFDAARAAVAGLRNLRASLEADATGGVAEKLRERLIQRIDENNALLAKTESLEAKLRALEGEVETWRRAAVLAVAPLEAMGIAGLVPSFCSDMQRGIAEGVVAVRDACREVEPRPTKGEEGANAP